VIEATPIPDGLRPYFWDVDFDALNWKQHQDFIYPIVQASSFWEEAGVSVVSLNTLACMELSAIAQRG
jgi:hypothetical protein